MKLETFAYSEKSGWSVRSFPELDSESTLVLVFGGSKFLDAPEPIRKLAQAYPKAVVAGCSTSGEILGGEVSDDSLTVAVIRFERTKVAVAFAEVGEKAGSWEAGKNLAVELDRPSLRGVLLLADGLKAVSYDLVAGINSIMPKSVVVTGGMAGDGDRFQRTWIIKGGELKGGYACAVGLYGDHVRIGHSSRGGWDVFGPERKITRSEGNVLFEIDDRPALPIYKEYLGKRAEGLPATGLFFPLSLRSAVSQGKRVVRGILAIDEAKQSITFAGDVPPGSLAQLMTANLDRLIQGATEAATSIEGLDKDSTRPLLSLAISCVGRRLVLGERSADEAEAILEVLPKHAQQIGFYAYGEIAPASAGQHCDLHNQTMTLTTISES